MAGVPLDQKARRAAVAAAFKAHKVPLRKGHWRLIGPEVEWWIDVTADSPSPLATMIFEVGAWVKGAGPKPEGGASDCPLLMDVPITDGAGEEAAALVDRLTGWGTVAALATAELAGVHLDPAMREVLGR